MRIIQVYLKRSHSSEGSLYEERLFTLLSRILELAVKKFPSSKSCLSGHFSGKVPLLREFMVLYTLYIQKICFSPKVPN